MKMYRNSDYMLGLFQKLHISTYDRQNFPILRRLLTPHCPKMEMLEPSLVRARVPDRIYIEQSSHI